MQLNLSHWLELGDTTSVLLPSRGEHATQTRQWEASCISLVRSEDATVTSNSKFSVAECSEVFFFFLRPGICSGRISVPSQKGACSPSVQVNAACISIPAPMMAKATKKTLQGLVSVQML